MLPRDRWNALLCLLVGLCSCQTHQNIPASDPPSRAPGWASLVVVGTFGSPETLVSSLAVLDSLRARHPYLRPDTLALLSPDSAWERNLREDRDSIFGEGRCEICEDGFYEEAALSLAQARGKPLPERAQLQKAMLEFLDLASCLSEGGTGFFHETRRIPLRVEYLLQAAPPRAETAEEVQDAELLLDRVGRRWAASSPGGAFDSSCFATHPLPDPPSPWVRRWMDVYVDRWMAPEP